MLAIYLKQRMVDGTRQPQNCQVLAGKNLAIARTVIIASFTDSGVQLRFRCLREKLTFCVREVLEVKGLDRTGDQDPIVSTGRRQKTVNPQVVHVPQYNPTWNSVQPAGI